MEGDRVGVRREIRGFAADGALTLRLQPVEQALPVEEIVASLQFESLHCVHLLLRWFELLCANNAVVDGGPLLKESLGFLSLRN